MKKWVACCVLFASLKAWGQNQEKTKLYVDCTCDDIIGAQYATALKDAVAKSPRYELATAASEGTGAAERYNFTLSIVTIDSNKTNPGVSAAISVVLVIAGFMVSQHIQTCGYNAIERCASQAIAYTDGDIDKWRKL